MILHAIRNFVVSVFPTSHAECLLSLENNRQRSANKLRGLIKDTTMASVDRTPTPMWLYVIHVRTYILSYVEGFAGVSSYTTMYEKHEKDIASYHDLLTHK